MRKRLPGAAVKEDQSRAKPNRIHRWLRTQLQPLATTAGTLDPRRRSDNKSAKPACPSSRECFCGYLLSHAGTIDDPSGCDGDEYAAECPLPRSPATSPHPD